MNKGLNGGWLRSAAFTLVLNLYFLISIPICHGRFRWDMGQSIYFVFGILFLFCVSLLCEQKRKLNNPWLGLFLLISLLSVFLHNFYFTPTTKYFINFSLMSEGFIYVLCGILLYKLIYEYGETLLRWYPCLWIASGVWLVNRFHFTSFCSSIWSICGAITIGMLVYLFYKKRFVLFYFSGFIATLSLWKYWFYICEKAQTRFLAWKQVIGELNVFGSGFDQSFNANTVDTMTHHRRVFINNDFLSIAKDLGIFALFAVVLIILHVFKHTRTDKLFFVCLAVIVLSLVKTSWYFVYNSILFIPLFSLLEARKNE